MGGLNQNDDNDDAFRGGGVLDLVDDMMTQHNKENIFQVGAKSRFHNFWSVLVSGTLRTWRMTNLGVISPLASSPDTHGSSNLMFAVCASKIAAIC